MIDLAEKSLALVAEDNDYVLRVSDIDILTLIIDGLTDSKYVRSDILRLASDKNLHEMERLCIANDIPEERYSVLISLLRIYGRPSEVVPQVIELCRGTEAEEEAGELEAVMVAFMKDGRDSHIVIDFSIIGDTNYYNGVALEGYIDGLPECVLVGGRYDKLMQRMNWLIIRKCKK